MADIDKIKQFYRERRKLKYRRLALTAAAVLFLTLSFGAVVIFFIMTARNGSPDGKRPAADASAPAETDRQEQTTGSETDGASETADTSGADTTGLETSEPEDTATPKIPEDYDYTKPVPESAAVDFSYYDDALFIGDSRTEGFRMFAGLNNATYYSEKGLNASTVFTDAFIPSDGMSLPEGTQTSGDGKLTVAQALEHSGYFGKIYIMLGINELGWVNTDVFIKYYTQLVGLARDSQPDAYIYVQLILPVSKSKSDSDEIYNNERIALFNGLIARMCADEHVFYINTPEAVAGGDGALPEDAGVDGVHMKRSYCELWRDYLLRHTVNN